tara:strand:+ start:9571 stop:9720 length:150 start_codon:yes stop_codon:yes gene_type:complete
METEELIEKLKEYIKWNGVRYSITDELAPNNEQPETVDKAIILLTDLVG